ncbi:WD40 repeat domain-containing serine/threonine protein kinase [Limnoglobus roseus]|uniref:WD40 repeat domain-containing serine/threonine protein kinase n=1 Tax=Limnoglobus roseus TaxID=2598579 RepID=UPI0011EAF6AB|nr:WD40 repeat domain-containing serine/threonine protein kinase [Limnoglobus roseus]
MTDPTLPDPLLEFWAEHSTPREPIEPSLLCWDRPDTLPQLNRRIRSYNAIAALLDDPDLFPVHPFGSDSTAFATDALPRIDGYEVYELIGRGGMGFIYHARQVALNRPVALKIVAPTIRTHAELTRRFLREAEIIANLRHPNIVPVYDRGAFDGDSVYFSMEWMPGGNLADRTTERPQNPVAAAALVRTLALAMAAAHACGVVHRDLKPGNILFTADNTPKIADFGLAQQMQSELTLPDMVLGTPSYMPPEQAKPGAVVGPLADVYALGAILYSLLTGRPPFRGETPWATVQQVLRGGPPPPRSFIPDLPKDLEAICLKCLQKHPGDRYASASDLADDLTRFADGRPVKARPIGPAKGLWRRMERHPLISILSLALVLLTVLGGTFARLSWLEVEQANRVAERERYLTQLQNVRERRVDDDPDWPARNLEALTALAADPAAADHWPTIRTETAAALTAPCFREVRRIDLDFQSYCTGFSPDGRLLAVIDWSTPDRGRVAVIDLATGDRVRSLSYGPSRTWSKLTNKDDGGRVIGFSPDGRWLIAGLRSGRIARWDLQSTATHAESVDGHEGDNPDPAENTVWCLTFSPDGQTALTGTRNCVRGWSLAPEWGQRFRKTDLQLEEPTRTVGRPFGLLFHRPSGECELVRIDPVTGDTSSAVRPFPNSRFAVSPDGRWTVKLMPEGLKLRSLTADVEVPLVSNYAGRHNLDLKSLGFVRGNRYLVTAEEHEHRLKLWDSLSGFQLTTRITGNGSLRFGVSPDRQRIAVPENNTVRVFEFAHSPVADAVGPYTTDQLFAVAMSPSGNRVVALTRRADGRETIVRYPPDDSTADPITDLPAGPTRRPLIAVHESGLTAATAEYNAQLLYVDGREPIRFDDPTDLAFDSGLHLWVTDGHTVKGVAVDTGAVTPLFDNDPAMKQAGMVFKCLAVGRDHLLVGRRDGSAFRIEKATGTARSWVLGTSATTAVSFGPDEASGVAGCENGQLYRLGWDGQSPQPFADRHHDAVTGVVVRPAYVVTASLDRTVRFWDTDGRYLFRLTASGPVHRLFASDDGRWLLAHVEGEIGVRRWDVPKLLAAIAAVGAPVPAAP